MSLHHAASGVTLISLPWVNAWLIYRGREAVLIDSGTRWDRGAVEHALQKSLPPDSRLTAVLQTHGHCDHAGNAAWLREHRSALLHAHDSERVFLETRRTYVPRGVGAASLSGALFAMGELVFPVRRTTVDVVLRDGDRVDSPIGPLTVIHTPGHTPGHVSYFHEQEGWLFSGDALINVIPFVRRTGLCLPIPVFTSDGVAALRSAHRIADLDSSVLFPGHGWPLTERTAETIRKFMSRHPLP